MTTQELNKIIQAVDNINEDLEKQIDIGCESDTHLMIKYLSNYMVYIEFLGHIIWHSDSDEREWIEETEEINPSGSETLLFSLSRYEPMEKYLRRKINELISNISKVKL